MLIFLFSSAIGFTIYQLAVRVFITNNGSTFIFGNSSIDLSPAAAILLRQIVAVLLIVVGLWLLLLLHQPFGIGNDRLRGAIILGLFYGPLLAIWINSLVANPSDESPSTGQYIAGAGLILLFLVGVVGEQAGTLIQQYARQISKISVGGAELSFTQKQQEKSSFSGPLALSGTPTYTSSAGASGLDYLAKLARMIERDVRYLPLLRKYERPESRTHRFGTGAGSFIGDFYRNLERSQLWRLKRAQSFATIVAQRPAACLASWHEVTGDGQSINRHVAGFAELFKQLPQIETDASADQLATEFIKRSFLIASDAVASVPSYILAGGCDDLLNQFCPEAFNHEPVRRVGARAAMTDNKSKVHDHGTKLRECLGAIERRDGDSPVLQGLHQQLKPYVSDFVAKRGWEARPYYAVGYASILSQLGQDLAASAVLDNWIRMRTQRSEPVWDTAKDWYDVRARSILVNYLENWLRKEGALAPTSIRDEHIANLDLLRASIEDQLKHVDFFPQSSAATSWPIFDRGQDRFRVVDKLRNPSSCTSREADLELWRQLFETYVTAQLSYLNAIIDHPDYAEQYSEKATVIAAALVELDLSCIPRVEDFELVHPKARTYYAQILNAYGTNVLRYIEAHKESGSDSATQRRLSEASRAVEFGRNLIHDLARKDRERIGAPFLKRIQASEPVETEERLKLTAAKLKRMIEAQQ